MKSKFVLWILTVALLSPIPATAKDIEPGTTLTLDSYSTVGVFTGTRSMRETGLATEEVDTSKVQDVSSLAESGRPVFVEFKYIMRSNGISAGRSIKSITSVAALPTEGHVYVKIQGEVLGDEYNVYLSKGMDAYNIYSDDADLVAYVRSFYGKRVEMTAEVVVKTEEQTNATYLKLLPVSVFAIEE